MGTGYSEAYAELGNNPRSNIKRISLVQKPFIHNTSKVVDDIIGMLSIASEQSELVGHNENYIYLSRLDNILSHLDTKDVTSKIREVGNKLGIKKDIIDTHLLWISLRKKEILLPDIFNIAYKKIKENKNGGKTIEEKIKDRWKEVDKVKLSSVVSDFTTYRKLIHYFCIRYFGKELEEKLKS